MIGRLPYNFMGGLLSLLAQTLAGPTQAQGIPPATPTATESFEWAETQDPDDFPGGQTNRQSLPDTPYIYRFDPSTQNCVAVAGTGRCFSAIDAAQASMACATGRSVIAPTARCAMRCGQPARRKPSGSTPRNAQLDR
ncbi:MAG: hypothetical protein IPI03_00205 [Rubrivivax sp.]|nr:hypothetical protein [Rubrivivax sp.]MBK8526051.1 hypothetical protein [Rubrivivax sp.]